MTKKGVRSSKTNQQQVLKLRNQSDTGIKSSSQVIKEKLGIKRQKDPIQKILQTMFVIG
jgi:hypothetical protein